MVRQTAMCLLWSWFSFICIWHAECETAKSEIIASAKRATTFMMDRVSNRGGLLWYYTEDLSEQWGEIPARKSMVWVQDSGTVGAGEVFLRAYKITGDGYYLEQAERIANVLIYGQHPSGGWHYFIDFDPQGVAQWYRDVASKFWGWEEYYHYDGNCTFDDSVTVGAARFLLDVYSTTNDPKYRLPLDKALQFILDAQFPNGAWPQRYPLEDAYPLDGQSAYTTYYTFNDAVIQDNIAFLLEAYERLGGEHYREAARRGMDFVLLAQYPSPQAGWGQQYDYEMRIAAARSCEPAALTTAQTASCIYSLIDYYKITGDRRYLQGIPAALEWLDNSPLPKGHSDNLSHALFYEIGTNRPLYLHREGSEMETGRYWVDYEPVNILPGYGYQLNIYVEPMRKAYEHALTLSPEEAKAEYLAAQAAKRNPQAPKVEPERMKELLDSLDERGAWVEEITLPNFHEYINGLKRSFRGIAVRSYLKNMHTLLDALEGE